MNRRDALKLIPVAGLALWGGKHLLSSRDVMACYMITEAPEPDARRLMRLAGFDSRDVHVTTMPVAPSAQDLTIIWNGTPIDPATDPTVSDELASLARMLRARPGRGHRLIAIEPRAERDDAAITFEVNGIVQERVSTDRSYRRIAIAGVAGSTVFRLDGGRLSVVEASCRHQLCRKMRGQTSGRIICAPNRLVATLPPSYRTVDAMTG